MHPEKKSSKSIRVDDKISAYGRGSVYCDREPLTSDELRAPKVIMSVKAFLSRERFALERVSAREEALRKPHDPLQVWQSNDLHHNK